MASSAAENTASDILLSASIPARNTSHFFACRSKRLYQTLEYVAAAYVIEVRLPEAAERAILLVALAASKLDAERAARASISTMPPLCNGRDITADLTAFEPDSLTAWLAGPEIKEFY